MPLLVSPHLIMQQLPNLSFLTIHLSFILNITSKFHFLASKLIKLHGRPKKLDIFQKWQKQG